MKKGYLGSSVEELSGHFGLPVEKIKEAVQFYQELLPEENDSETRVYLRDKTKQACRFIKQLSGRKCTVLRVLEEIVELQKDYFEHGVSRLKPMPIAEVADRLHLHQPTVSRAISGKYIICFSGTVSIKSLFTSKIRARGKEDCFSSLQIKETVRILIEHENKSAPLSDQKITWSLQEKCIDISRCAVAPCRRAQWEVVQHFQNAYAESFHLLIKREWLNRFRIQDNQQAYHMVFEYIDTFYNTVRIHSHCGLYAPR